MPQSKHIVRQIYLVTLAFPQEVTAQHILHPLSTACAKLIIKEYITQPKIVQIHHSQQATTNLDPDPPISKPLPIKVWNQINKRVQEVEQLPRDSDHKDDIQESDSNSQISGDICDNNNRGAPGIEWLLPESVRLKGDHAISQGVEKFLQDTGNAQTGPNKKSSSSSMVSIPGTLLS